MQTPIRLLFVFGLILVAGPVAHADEAEVRILPDIPYKSGAALTDYEQERCKLDLYLPEVGRGFATILWFHGGGLKNGDKSGSFTPAIAKRFAKDGVAVALANYRLYPRAKYPEAIDDAAASFAWLHAHIGEHGGDADKIFVSGHSAGGYLSAMVGVAPQFLKAHGLGTNAIAGVIPVSGQMITHSSVREERGIPATTPIIDEAAPAYHARTDAPPFLCIAGSEDLPARAAENIYFVAAMQAAGHKDIAYREFAGRTHGSVANQIPEAADPVATAILDFIACPAGKK